MNGVDLDVAEGEIVGIIGPNGAGKTTLFNCLTGIEVPTSGEIRYRGRRLRGTPDRITDAGLARTFQNIRLFPNVTVLENVLVGPDCPPRGRRPRRPSARAPELHRREERGGRSRGRCELLDLVGHAPAAADDLARNLHYGDQRRLEIARAIATDPSVLLLDEPTAGMNPAETRELGDLIRQIRDQG